MLYACRADGFSREKRSFSWETKGALGFSSRGADWGSPRRGSSTVIGALFTSARWLGGTTWASTSRSPSTRTEVLGRSSSPCPFQHARARAPLVSGAPTCARNIQRIRRGKRLRPHAQPGALQRHVPEVRVFQPRVVLRPPPHDRPRPPLTRRLPGGHSPGRFAAQTPRTAPSAPTGPGCTSSRPGASSTVGACLAPRPPCRVLVRPRSLPLHAEIAPRFPCSLRSPLRVVQTQATSQRRWPSTSPSASTACGTLART